jgi:type I restriction enzyme S subunit
LNDHIYSLARGAAQKNLDVSAFRNMEISYPESIPEQHRIVKILSEFFEKIEKAKKNTEKNLQNSHELFESYLNSIFENPGSDWDEKTLEDIIETTMLGLDKSSKQQGQDKKFKYVKMNNITVNNNFDFRKFTCVDAIIEEVQKYKLFDGDFLFNTRNSYELVGKTCVFKDQKESVLFNNNILRIRFTNDINSFFINYSFSSSLGKNQLTTMKSGTTNVSAIYFKNLKNFRILIPEKKHQDSIVEKLDKLSEQIKKLEEIYRQKLADLEELKKSILQKAFAGELAN